MAEPIPALSLWRPWPHLILTGAKPVENRGWGTGYRGPMWIHAGKTWQDLDVDWLQARGIDPRTVATDADHPTGIVGLVELTGVCVRSTWNTCDCGPWAIKGERHWQLADPRPLPEPVPCAGRQGLWWPTDELAEQLTAVAS